MRHPSLPLTALVLGIAVFILTGCLGPGTSKPTQFYVLNSLYSRNAKPPPVANLADIGIGVGPVRLPQQLNRPQIVTRTDENEIHLAGFAQWGEPLAENFARVLSENLAILLATHNMAIFPWMKPVKIDYQVTVDVMRFSGRPGRDVQLRARWTIYGQNGQRELFKGHTELKEPVREENISAMVAAQSRTLEVLSRQIAEAIKKLAGGNS